MTNERPRPRCGVRSLHLWGLKTKRKETSSLPAVLQQSRAAGSWMPPPESRGRRVSRLSVDNVPRRPVVVRCSWAAGSVHVHERDRGDEIAGGTATLPRRHGTGAVGLRASVQREKKK